MIDGVCLFYMCPDWRTRQIQNDVSSVAGKLGLMPLPAWEPGGLRTSTWGGTGLAFTNQCRNPDLAWKLAMYLYYDRDQLGPRFADTNILPPLKSAWNLPEFQQPRASMLGTLSENPGATGGPSAARLFHRIYRPGNRQAFGGI